MDKLPYAERLEQIKKRKEIMFNARRDKLFSLTQKGDLKLMVKKLEIKVTREKNRRERFAKRWLSLIYLVKVCEEATSLLKKRQINIQKEMRALTLGKIFTLRWRRHMGVEKYYKAFDIDIFSGLNMDRTM